MKVSLLYRVFIVCTWSGRVDVRLVRRVADVEEIDAMFAEFDHIAVHVEPAVLPSQGLSTADAAA